LLQRKSSRVPSDTQKGRLWADGGKHMIWEEGYMCLGRHYGMERDFRQKNTSSSSPPKTNKKAKQTNRTTALRNRKWKLLVSGHLPE